MISKHNFLKKPVKLGVLLSGRRVGLELCGSRVQFPAPKKEMENVMLGWKGTGEREGRRWRLLWGWSTKTQYV